MLLVDLLKNQDIAKLVLEDRREEIGWLALVEQSMVKDWGWDNEQDSIYDNWKEHYNVKESDLAEVEKITRLVL